MSIVYLITAILFIGYIYQRCKDIFHPAIIFLFVWYVTAIISCVDYSSYITPWCLKMHIVVYFSGVCFFVGTLLFLKKNTERQLRTKHKTSNVYNYICYGSYAICIICILLEWRINGYEITLLSEQSGDLKSEMSGTEIPGVHYGTVLFPFIGLFIFYKIINEKKYIDIFLLIISICIAFFLHVSRGELMIYIFGILFIYSRYRRIKTKNIIVSLFLLFFVIFFIMQMRVGEDSLVNTSKDNMYWSVIYTYTATCFANLNDLILSDAPFHLPGNITLAPLWTLFGIRDDMSRIEMTQLDIFNARTYLYGFYHDYKLVGICFFPFLFGGVLTGIFNQLKSTSPYWLLLMAALQKAIYFSFFGNYLTGEFVLLFPYIFIFMLWFLNQLFQQQRHYVRVMN